jgi:hypothetical protein
MHLGNDVLLGCLRALNVYEHPENHQLIRVNYAALNVEEFGSVYEGLLEYKPVFHNHGNLVEFVFAQGDERAATGFPLHPGRSRPAAHQALARLPDRRAPQSSQPGAALLDLRVADIACGSGHILLAAARRIATGTGRRADGRRTAVAPGLSRRPPRRNPDLHLWSGSQSRWLSSCARWPSGLRLTIPASRSTFLTTTSNAAMPSLVLYGKRNWTRAFPMRPLPPCRRR